MNLIKEDIFFLRSEIIWISEFTPLWDPRCCQMLACCSHGIHAKKWSHERNKSRPDMSNEESLTVIPKNTRKQIIAHFYINSLAKNKGAKQTSEEEEKQWRAFPRLRIPFSSTTSSSTEVFWRTSSCTWSWSVFPIPLPPFSTACNKPIFLLFSSMPLRSFDLVLIE